jgi:hypothetical protein
VIRPRQPIAPWHVLPVCIVCPLVALTVDLGNIFEMSRTLALIVYGGQVTIALLVYFSVFVVNRIDLDWFYAARQRGTVLSKRGPLAYFIFVVRISLLCAVEAGTVVSLAVSRHILAADSEETKSAVVGLVLGFAAIHTLFEVRRLGEAAWEIRETKPPTSKRPPMPSGS